ncbi:UNVERIFIED_CONTAM: hypothetical protein K2H54_052489 [Gekko kuhli]
MNPNEPPPLTLNGQMCLGLAMVAAAAVAEFYGEEGRHKAALPSAKKKPRAGPGQIVFSVPALEMLFLRKFN